MLFVATAICRRVRDTPAEQGGYRIQLRLLRGSGSFRAAVTARKFLDPSGGIDKFLFPCEKRMAGSTDADFNIGASRAGVIDRAARTDDIGLVILGMNVRFHIQKRACKLRATRGFRK